MSDDLIKLDDICEKVFNVTAKIARRKAVIYALPIPAFRLTNSGRGPFFVNKADLDAHVAKRISTATAQHKKMADADA